MRNTLHAHSRQPREMSFSVETSDDEDALELPIEPDDGGSLIPDDDDRVVNVPS